MYNISIHSVIYAFQNEVSKAGMPDTQEHIIIAMDIVCDQMYQSL
jgi:hypothetical protein